jgi:nucleoside-diphosphate-sugar epimerase
MNRPVVAITGGSGYVGSSLGKYLSRSFEVKLLDVAKPRCNNDASLNFQACDVRNYEQLKKSLENVDLVIHTSIIQIPLINEQKRRGFEVNVLGTQNVCKAVDETPSVKGMVLSGSWHTIGEKKLSGVIDEEFGFKPDNVEDRARLYALSKIAQETIIRFYDEMSSKVFGIIRMGTVLGENMPEKTAANIFIENGLKGQPITPFSSSMFRPMLYVDLEDICRAYESFAKKILNETKKSGNSLAHVFNVYYPEAITIFDVATIVKSAIIELSKGSIRPEIQVIENNQSSQFSETGKKLIKPNINKALNSLDLKELRSPNRSIRRIVASRMDKLNVSEMQELFVDVDEKAVYLSEKKVFA